MIKTEKSKHTRNQTEGDEHGDFVRANQRRRQLREIDRALRTREIDELLDSDDLDW
jgi:hypothetical protein